MVNKSYNEILYNVLDFFPNLESIAEKVKEDVNLLHDLIRQHDVLFLLTDSRESRWLPTVIGSVEKKVCPSFHSSSLFFYYSTPDRLFYVVQLVLILM